MFSSPITKATAPDKAFFPSAVTAAYRLAGGILALALVPGFQRSSNSVRALVSKLAHLLSQLLETGYHVDGVLMWVYAVGGSASMRGDPFHLYFASKFAMELAQRRIGNGAGKEVGFGDVMRKLMNLWERDDDVREGMGEWRDVMICNRCCSHC